ncbi:hypothetical protein JCM19274_5069 [Algibacter lectus]|uniref:Uncharacterized protein n=1 Tax=Algibacter lectus TaxID=221126 RepID=A0A090WK27_9FLAO|nr:hypothetical protein JCM19274_5069 [Algibacter lectus]
MSLTDVILLSSAPVLLMAILSNLFCKVYIVIFKIGIMDKIYIFLWKLINFTK